MRSLDRADPIVRPDRPVRSSLVRPDRTVDASGRALGAGRFVRSVQPERPG